MTFFCNGTVRGRGTISQNSKDYYCEERRSTFADKVMDRQAVPQDVQMGLSTKHDKHPRSCHTYNRTFAKYDNLTRVSLKV